MSPSLSLRLSLSLLRFLFRYIYMILGAPYVPMGIWPGKLSSHDNNTDFYLDKYDITSMWHKKRLRLLSTVTYHSISLRDPGMTWIAKENARHVYRIPDICMHIKWDSVNANNETAYVTGTQPGITRNPYPKNVGCGRGWTCCEMSPISIHSSGWIIILCRNMESQPLLARLLVQ